MNGATAEPCDSTISAPSRAIAISVGASQNFLRTLRKAQNSFRNDIMSRGLLELAGHRRVRLARRHAMHPVAGGRRVETALDRILSAQAQDDAGRHDRHDVEE